MQKRQNRKLAADPACAFFAKRKKNLIFNAKRVGSFLILSSRVFERELPQKDSDSSPKLALFIVGNLQRLVVLILYSTHLSS